LARAAAARRRLHARDKLLVLAAAQAAEAGYDEVAQACRAKILDHNRQHLVRHWPTVREALGEERFEAHLRQLRRRYSPERSEHLLAALGIELADERALYESDEEYAASLLVDVRDVAPALAPLDLDAPAPRGAFDRLTGSGLAVGARPILAEGPRLFGWWLLLALLVALVVLKLAWP
jgi:hypothetical protein